MQVSGDGPGRLILKIASYSPMRDAVLYLDQRYGWLISYEDPLYPDSEVEDIAIPQWKKAHPGERGFYSPVYTQARFEITKPSGRPDDQQTVLVELTTEFNKLNRPDKFVLFNAAQNRSVVVGTVGDVSILEQATARANEKSRTGTDEFVSLIQACSSHTQIPLTIGTASANTFAHVTVPPRKTKLSCRAAFVALSALCGSDVMYILSEDLNQKALVVNIISNHIVSPPPNSP